MTRLAMTMHVILVVSVLRSLRARMRRGTMTARTGAVTSATKVVDERALMVEGTAVGEAMASTSLSTCGLRSGLYMVPVRVMAALRAAVAT